MKKQTKNKILFLEKGGDVYGEISVDLIALGANTVLVRNLFEVDRAIAGFQPNIVIVESWFIKGDYSILKKWSGLIKRKPFLFIFLINTKEDSGFQKLVKKHRFNFEYSCVYISRKKYEKIADAIKEFLS